MTTRKRETVARCGTYSGYNAHIRRGEKACPACFAASHEYEMRRKEAPANVARGRLRSRAQRRALIELSHLHREEYAAIYARHMAEARQEFPA